MGTIWLRDIADVLRAAGLVVIEQPGWQTRARGSGGFDSLRGIQVHHTAESALMDGKSSSVYMTFNHPFKPCANLYVDRKGQFWIQAAGASNTAGAGGPWGDIPLDSANARSIGIEIGNNGIGEPYPIPQQDAILKGYAAIFHRYGPEHHWGDDMHRVFAHFEWAPTRKIDPWGPSRWTPMALDGSQRSKWSMFLFGADVLQSVRKLREPITPPVTTPPTGGAVMFEIFLVRNPAGGLFNAAFYGYKSSNGIVRDLAWSGDGSDPQGKVAKRHAAYLELEIPVEELSLAQLQNITLLGPVPQDTSRIWDGDRDFCNHIP